MDSTSTQVSSTKLPFVQCEPFLTIFKKEIFKRLGGHLYQISDVCKVWNQKYNEFLEDNRLGFWFSFGKNRSNQNQQQSSQNLIENSQKISKEEVIIIASHCTNGYFEDLANYNFHLGTLIEDCAIFPSTTISAVVARYHFTCLSVRGIFIIIIFIC